MDSFQKHAAIYLDASHHPQLASISSPSALMGSVSTEGMNLLLVITSSALVMPVFLALWEPVRITDQTAAQI